MPIPPPSLSASWEEIRRWRKLVREDQLQRRTALAPALRHEIGARARQRLVAAIDLRAYPILGICWAIRGEIDVRRIAERHIEAGGLVALPVVVQKAAPVEFWRWYPGVPMTTGLWNIPIPEPREILAPDALIVPLVGYDAAGYRLGYGGGYFDRTLAATACRPLAIGLGYATSALPTIYPQPHDIPMNLIVTDQDVLRVNQ